MISPYGIKHVVQNSQYFQPYLRNVSLDFSKLKAKDVYNRSTNSTAFCSLQLMSLPTPFPSMQLK